MRREGSLGGIEYAADKHFGNRAGSHGRPGAFAGYQHASARRVLSWFRVLVRVEPGRVLGIGVEHAGRFGHPYLVSVHCAPAGVGDNAHRAGHARTARHARDRLAPLPGRRCSHRIGGDAADDLGRRRLYRQPCRVHRRRRACRLRHHVHARAQRHHPLHHLAASLVSVHQPVRAVRHRRLFVYRGVLVRHRRHPIRAVARLQRTVAVSEARLAGSLPSSTPSASFRRASATCSSPSSCTRCVKRCRKATSSPPCPPRNRCCACATSCWRSWC